MNIKRLISLFVIIGVIGCLILFAIFFRRANTYKSASNQVLARIANQLGVDEKWETVRQDIYCNVIVDGLTLGEIEDRLATLTLIDVSQNDIEGYEYFIYFTEPYVNLDDLFLLFNEDSLLDEKWLSVGFGDIAEIDCP